MFCSPNWFVVIMFIFNEFFSYSLLFCFFSYTLPLVTGIATSNHWSVFECTEKSNLLRYCF